MNFSVGETLRIEGQNYEIIGKIEFHNLVDRCLWMEYRLYSHSRNEERWLSCDNMYLEYSISKVVGSASTVGYHEVDRGTAEVVNIWGNVDVEVGDQVQFVEYEDITEEKIVSREIWDDGEEMSTGYYLDDYEVQRANSGDSNEGNHFISSGGDYQGNLSRGKIGLGLVVVFLAIQIIIPLFMSLQGSSTTTISKYLSKTSTYTYVTSITGSDKEKADVYSTNYTVDMATKDIINAIDGETESVQQNTEDEDDSVAILTSKEYCLVYTSEDGETLVQISTRKYAYANDDDPYRSRSGTRRYYRRFYYSRGYYGDMADNSSTSSPYSDYSDRTIDSNSGDTYSTYSSSVRQASAAARASSGGGTSSGK